MSRKSKGKFNMKGHSIPGISGFKSTSLEDGRAASSAFQMKESPLYEETTELEFTKPELGKVDPNAHLKWKSQGSRTGVQFGMEEAMKAAQRLRGKGGKEEEEEEVIEEEEVVEEVVEEKDVIDEQIDKYDKEKVDVEEKSFENLENQIAPVEYPEVAETGPDFSTFESVNDLVAERTKWKKENPDKRSRDFPGQDEINKRLKENPNQWGSK